MDKEQVIMTSVFLLIMIIVGGLFALSIHSTTKHNEETYAFYEEWCPTLNANFKGDPISRGQWYNPRCFKVINNEVKYYTIHEVNGKKYLKEVEI